MNDFKATRRPAITQKWIFQKLLLQILNNWMWILLSVLFAVSIAFLTNRYNSKVYRTSIQVIKGYVEDAQEAAYMFGGGMEGGTVNIKYEKAFITSLPVMEAVVRELNLNVSYYSRGRVKTTERYGSIPIRMEILKGSGNLPYYVQFVVVPGENNTYTLLCEDERWKNELENRTFTFGQEAQLQDFHFKIFKVGPMDTGEWLFSVNRVEDVAKSYQRSVAVSEVRQGSYYSRGSNSILELSMQSTLPQKDRQFLNMLFLELQKADVEKKIRQSEKTIAFIEQQLVQIEDSMKIIAAQIRTMKLSNKELSAGSQFVFGKITGLEEQKSALLLVNRYCDYLEDYINSSSSDEIIAPSTFGINNDILGGLVNRFIELQLEIKEDEELEFITAVMEREIRQKQRRKEEIEDLILQSIASTRHANTIHIDEYDQQIDVFFKSARAVLSEEIVFADFERLYDLNENVFTMLMDKKAEAGISQASIISDYSIFEQAITSGVPLRPQSRRNYITGLMLGFVIPISFLFLKTLNKNTILSLRELEEIVSLPVAGVIGYSSNPRTMLDTPQSLVSENFRSLRSNLRFVNGENNRTIFVVTSSVSAEGKTFISANLAASMALQDKKTIVIGADLRKPTLQNYFNDDNQAGLSQYLIGDVTLDEVIQPGGIDNLDVIYSGPVPPNPSELLAGEQMEKLLTDLRKRYEIIFIDTPPIGLISDASELFDIVDSVLLVARQQKTPVSTLTHVDHFMDESSLSKSMLIFNGVRKGVGYGYYGYGYGYGYGGYGYGTYSGYYKEDDKRGRRSRKKTKS